MIVVDASAILEALLRTPTAKAVEKWLFDLTFASRTEADGDQNAARQSCSRDLF
jgi:hypothetical protein